MGQTSPTMPSDIDEVLEALDRNIARWRGERSRLGYFAAMYRIVTATVKQGIEDGFFDDAQRMERLDVVFANRYLAAVAAFEHDRGLTRSWQLACAAASRWRPLALQHVLAAINAHINLDLGIAAAEVAPGEELPGLRRDFDRINEILATLQRQVQRDIGEISPWIGVLDLLGGRSDDMLVRFSIEVARTKAWRFASELATLPPDQRAGPIRARDAIVARVGWRLLNPGVALSGALLPVRLRERDDVADNIAVLGGVEPPDLDRVEARVRSARALDERE